MTEPPLPLAFDLADTYNLNAPVAREAKNEKAWLRTGFGDCALTMARCPGLAVEKCYDIG